MPIAYHIAEKRDALRKIKGIIAVDMSTDVQLGLLARTNLIGEINIVRETGTWFTKSVEMVQENILPEGPDSENLFMQSVFMIYNVEIWILDTMKEQYNILSDFMGMFSSPNIVNFLPYYNLTHSTLIANMIFDHEFKINSEGKLVNKLVFGGFFLDVDSTLDMLVRSGVPIQNSSAIDNMIREEANIDKSLTVQIQPNVTLLLDGVFDFVEEMVKNLSLRDLVCIYHMMIQVVEDAPDSNKRKTDGLDALSLAEYSMNTYKKDLQGEGEDDGRDKQEVQYRQRNKEAVSHPK